MQEKTKTAFILMPFDEEYKDVYPVWVKQSLREIGWKCERSDERWDTLEIVCTS